MICTPKKSHYILIFFISLIFGVTCNSFISSLTVMPDETIYWTGASAIAGYPTSAFGSWTLGYSLLLTPAFTFLSDYQDIYLATKLINSFLFSINVLLIHILYSEMNRIGVIKSYNKIIPLVTSMYPFFIAISGYLMAENAIMPFYLASILFLNLFFEGGKFKYLLGLTFILSFLYVINPKSIVFLIAVILVFVFTKRKPIYYAVLLIPYALLLCIYSYFEIYIHERYSLGNIVEHYPSVMELFSVLFEKDKLFDFITRMLGQNFYLMFSTLGIYVLGFYYLIKGLIRDSKPHIYLYVGLSVIGTQVLVNLMFSIDPQVGHRLDHYMYGRYVEPLIAPILLLGIDCIFSNERKNKYELLTLGILCLFLGALFFVMHNGSWGFSYMNSSAFWVKEYLPELILDNLYVLIFSVLIFFYVNFSISWVQVTILFISFILSSGAHIFWHRNESKEKGNEVYIVDYINEGNKKCITYNQSAISSPYDFIPYYNIAWRLYDNKFLKVDLNEKIDGECADMYFSNVDLGRGDIRRFHYTGDWYLYEKTNQKWLQKRQFTNKDEWISDIFKDGWYKVENGYVWSKESSSIDLSFYKGETRNSILVLDVNVFGKERETKLVNFSCGKINKQFELIVGDLSQVSIPVSDCKQVNIEVIGASSPKSLGFSNDERTLGVMVSSIDLQRKK